ncbi:hypothetical protein J0H58_13685 [bacterium]|nr:hypothetical protein [bacterium]
MPLLLGCVAFCLLAVVAYAPTARMLTRDRGEHLTAADARGRARLDLPAAAADINFYRHARPDELVFVDFAIDEAGFLEWAARQGWKVQPIKDRVVVSPRLGFGDTATRVRITDGLKYRSNPAPGMPNAVVVNYDRVGRRAYYAFWSAPRTGEG